MIMIRPIIRANEWRKNKVHIIVFFIFLVANMGGCLTPLGDPPLFPTTREVELSWQILDPIEEFWSTLGQPQPYRSGTWGPQEATEMLARDGHRWRMP